MNTTKQFWSLFKFQTTINPFIWFVPVAFGMPFFLPLFMDSFSFSKTYHSSLSTVFMSNQNLFFVGIFGAMVLAPEKFQMAAANLVSTYYGSEFILTRAIDRPILYRAKAAILYLLVLTLPCVAIANSLRNPDLIASEYSKVVQHQCLEAVPASTLIPATKKDYQPLISIPRGNVLVAEWQLWMMLMAALTLQILILILYPFKYGKIIFWVLYFGLILVPLFDLTHFVKDEATVNEQLFFPFAAHQPLTWILTALAFVLAQLWCERRFARLEQ